MTSQLAPAQSAEVIWQDDKKPKGWTVHLHVGAEVIKYHLPADRNAPDAELVAAAVKGAQDEGYTLDAAAVKVAR